MPNDKHESTSINSLRRAFRRLLNRNPKAGHTTGHSGPVLGSDPSERLKELEGQNEKLRTALRAAQESLNRNATLHEATHMGLLTAVMEATSDAVYIKDGKGRYVFANREAARMIGRDAADLLGRKADDVLGRDAGRLIGKDDGDRAVMEGGRIVTVEEAHVVEGQERTFLATKGPLVGADGQLLGLFSIARDITGLKQTQKALVESETNLKKALAHREHLNQDLRQKAEELDTIFNTAPIGIAVSYDPQCLRITGNPAYAAMLGVDPKTNLSKTARADQRPNGFKEMRDGQPIAPRDLPMQKAAVRGMRINNFEMDVARADGSTTRLLANAAPLLNEHGRPRGAVGVFLDVSELKKTQEDLSKAHRKIARILESITDAFLSFDHGWRYTYVNDTACRLFGRTREELLGRPALDAFPEAVRTRFYAEFARAMNEHRPIHFEVFLPPLAAWYECRCYPSSEGLSVYFEDVTERKKAEEAQIHHVAKLDALLDISQDVLAAASAEEMVRRVAEGARALTGSGLSIALAGRGEGPVTDQARLMPEWPQGELFDPAERGHRGLLTQVPDHAPRAGDHPAWWGIRAKERPEGTGLHEGGSPSSREDEAILSQLAAIATLGLRHIDARHAVEEMVEERTRELREAYQTLQREVKEHKMTERQLRQAQKMDALGRMASGIGHDFNNILAAIIGFGQLAHDRLVSGSKEKGHIERVLEAGLRGRDVVRQMLTFAGQGEQERTALQVTGIIDGTVKLLRPSIPSTIAINLDIHGEPGFVLANPAQIEQVLVNLCTNAADAMMQKGGRLDIELSDFVSGPGDGPSGMKPGEYMRLAVRDTGTGILPEEMERLFDPFFTTKKEKGAGLGLSVVHGIVEQAGGHITVESEPGKGSVFTVYLPKVMESRRSETVGGAEVVPTGRERILFVDDEESLVDIGRHNLKRLGYKVTATTSSVEALKMFEANPASFDLLMTDQTMPDMTGIELAGRVTALRREIPVILITGYSHLIDADTAEAAGVRAFVMKPLTRGEMARAVRKVLDCVALKG